MKKIIMILMCLFLLIPANVKASSDNFVESFEIIGLEDGSAKAGDELKIHVKLDDPNNEIKALGVTLAFEGKNYNTEDFWFEMNFNGNGTYVGKCKIDESIKYRYDEMKFQYIQFYGEMGENEEDTKTVAYSHLEFDEILYPGFFTSVYECDDYSFEVENSDLDTVAPVLDGDINVTLDNDVVYASVEASDDKLNISSSSCLTFINENMEQMTIYLHDTSEEGKVKGSTNNVYVYYPYGTYTLSSVTLCDENDNYSTIDTGLPNIQIELKAENNILENLSADQVYLANNNWKVTDKIEIRKDTGVRQNVFYLMCTPEIESANPSTDIMLLFADMDLSGIDTSKTGLTNYEYTFEYCVNNSGTTRQLTINIPIEVVDVVGEIVWPEDGFEYCLNYEDYADISSTELWELLSKETYAYIYETNQVEKVEAESGGFSFTGIGGTTLSSTFMVAETSYNFSPKYIDKDAEGRLNFRAKYKIYFVNKKGDLVDNEGKTLVKYKDREVKEFKDLASNVRIFTLEGTLPSYTKVNAKENDKLDDVFDTSYFAYDISLESEFDKNVQPLGDVDVTLELTKEFEGKELEVYYVDDNGNKQLIESDVENGLITFTTDHFSTYAVVEKASANPNNPNNNTNTDKAPGTGDVTNVAGLMAMLLASGYVFVRRKIS